MGLRFRESMRAGIAATLRALPEAAALARTPEEEVNVLHFLRGGLNFGLMDALGDAYGMNEHRASFLTSERARDEHGRWFIRDDQYVKLTLRPGSTVFIGDIVATGVTVAAGLAKLFEQTSGLPRDRLPPEVGQHLFFGLSEDHRRSLLASSTPGPRVPIRRLIFFTIGCHKVEKVVATYDPLFREVFPEYEGAWVVYLEGKFRLADSKTGLRIVEPGTDLLRAPAALAPEFELSQYESESHPLEACVIYDGGSRSYDTLKHRGDVRHYWGRVRELAAAGWTLGEALEERWPRALWSADRAGLAAASQTKWRGVEAGFAGRLWEAQQLFRAESFARRAAQASSLEELAAARVARVTELPAKR
jgi:hypothetical protein